MMRFTNASFWRSGTSKILLMDRRAADGLGKGLDDVILKALGSPDPMRRQIDGLGGGISSLSKVAVIGVQTSATPLIGYDFAQVSVDKPHVDWEGSCGNAGAAIAAFSLDYNYATSKPFLPGDIRNALDVQFEESPIYSGWTASVPILALNTLQRIVAHVPITDQDSRLPRYEGGYRIDGVPGSGAPIRLQYIDPANSLGRTYSGKKGHFSSALPSGNKIDSLHVPKYGRMEYSLVDSSMPVVFVDAKSFGITNLGTLSPVEMDADKELMGALEMVRTHASKACGFSSAPLSIPKIAVISTGDGGINARAVSAGNVHRTFPGLAAMCLAVASRIPGTIPANLSSCHPNSQWVQVFHPAGSIQIHVHVRNEFILETGIVRTCRKIMEGVVFH